MTESTIQNVLSLISQLQNLKTADAVVEATLGVMRPFGFDFLLVSRPRNPNQPLENVILGKQMRSELESVYADWMKYYSEHRYANADPVVRQMQRSWKPFAWREVTYDTERDQRAVEIMQQRMERGFGEAFVIPVFNRSGLMGYVSMSGNKIDLNENIRPAIHITSLCAFHRVCCLIIRNDSKIRLTPRECEVLSWVANGKSAWEIGEILKIAKRTVDEHVQSACKKLGAVNRPQAVAIAIRDHLIQL